MGFGQGAGRDHLKMMTAQDAFIAYEAVRHRLPSVQSNAACIRANTLDDIADEFDVFLLDAFGVLNIGETAIQGVPERIAGLQAAGKRVLVVTNAAGYPHQTLMTKYKRLGYNFAPEDVISSRKALLAGLQPEPKRHWGVMANPDLGRADLESLDLTYLGDDPAPYDAAEGFLLIGSSAWGDKRQTLLKSTLRNNPRPVLVGNPDIVAPRETGFSVEPGHYAHDLADATGIEPQFFGKPFHNIYDLVFDRIGRDYNPARIAMVGDSLHTDILGGQSAGVKTVLISGYGFFDGLDVTGPISGSGIHPDYVLERP